MRRITQTLTILRRVEGEPDRYGNPTLEWERMAWPVYAVAPRGQAGLSEPFEANRDPIVKGLQVFAPADGPSPVANDRVEHGGLVGPWSGMLPAGTTTLTPPAPRNAASS